MMYKLPFNRQCCGWVVKWVDKKLDHMSLVWFGMFVNRAVQLHVSGSEDSRFKSQVLTFDAMGQFFS